MKFKVGDRVRQIVSGWNTSPYDNEKEAVVLEVENDKIRIREIGTWALVTTEWRNERGFELISINQSTMDIKEKFQLAFKSEPEKSFRKAGVTNGDDYLTDGGQKIFLSWLLKKNGADFKKEVVDSLLEEEAK